MRKLLLPSVVLQTRNLCRLPSTQHVFSCRQFSQCFSSRSPPPYDSTKGFSPAPSTTFVSDYFQVSENEIYQFINRKNLDHKLVGHEIVVKDCPFCHDIKNKHSNMWKLYIHKSTGAYMCHRCGVKGSWYDFKNKLLFGGNADFIQPLDKQQTVKKLTIEEVKEYKKSFSTERFQTLNKYLQSRGIQKEIAEKYGVGAGYFNFYEDDGSGTPKSVSALCIVFPMVQPVYKPATILSHIKKKRATRKKKQDEEVEQAPAAVSGEENLNPEEKPEEKVENEEEQASQQPVIDEYTTTRLKIRDIAEKSHQKLHPAGGRWGLFGLDTVPQNAKTIVLTEGEFDAMAVHQATGLPAVSLPNGCRSLPIEILPFLERYERIYLWMDDDTPGQEGAEQFANKLGIGRCFIVHSSTSEDNFEIAPKDANEALIAGVNLQQCIDEAAPLEHKRIITFGNLKKEVYRELYENSLEIAGVPSKFFPKMNKILKGHRRGELTILSGPTGIGKTTILSQITLDYAIQGINTLWGSFEIKNHRLATKMLSQLAGKPMNQHKDEFDIYVEDFERLPLYFMNFYGSTDIDQVLDAMDYAVYVYDVQHVVIDNLQFMMSGQGAGYEKFEMQDKAIEKFRLFATQKNVHITVVIHPKKVEDGLRLGIASIFGTAKATQEADNVILIQTGRKYRSLMVKKNRFDGTLGEMPYRFDRSSSRIYELTDEQLKEVDEGKIILEY